MNLIFALNPDLDKVGLLYDVGQDSSTTAINDAKAYLSGKNVEIVEKTGTNVSEIMLAAQALIDAGCKAVFTPSDNTVMTAELSIYETLSEAGVQHYAGADSFALNGAFLGYGVDYANLGKETANMVCDILVNKKDIASYPVRTFDNGTATVNTDICSVLGLNYDEVKNTISPYCSRASFYRNFSTTSDVLDALFDETISRLMNISANIFTSADEVKWRDFLFRYIYFLRDSEKTSCRSDMTTSR